MSYREMWLFRYSKEGAAGILNGGFAARRDALAGIAEASGGKVVDLAFFSGDDEWDAMLITEYERRPSDAARATTDFMARGEGTIEAQKLFPLVDPADIDTFRAKISLWDQSSSGISTPQQASDS